MWAWACESRDANRVLAVLRSDEPLDLHGQATSGATALQLLTDAHAFSAAGPTPLVNEGSAQLVRHAMELWAPASHYVRPLTFRRGVMAVLQVKI